MEDHTKEKDGSEHNKRKGKQKEDKDNDNNNQLKMPTIPASSFYSSQPPTGEWARILGSVRDNMKNKSLSSYKVFPKQELAFNFVDLHLHEDLHVFAEEYKRTEAEESSSDKTLGRGIRRYIACSYSEFWRKYAILMEENKPLHFYEVIRENTACHLYFDLEYKREYNPQILSPKSDEVDEGYDLVAIFMDQVCKMLHTKFKVEVPADRILILDSSTDSKFSCHVLVKLVDTAFASNLHIGGFVELLASHLEAERSRNFDIDRVFVYTDKGMRVLIADLGVYTRNRCFRIYKSSKLGSDAKLLLFAGNKFLYSNESELFYSSLICNVEFTHSLRLLTCGENINNKVNRKRKASSGSSCSTINAINTDMKSTVIDDGEVINSTNSPYLEVDAFISTKINRGGSQGRIRQCIYFSTSKTIVYNISNNRYCENIGREHKSNNVMIICDLIKGVYYQMCYDIDCRGFRSMPFSLPFELCAFFKKINSSKDNSKLDFENDHNLLSDEDLLEVFV
eukprot:TRINITY_DN6590_c0_g1_i1.p1 TRINITY_DN6590_c0_g1~~TRINITY_DN6590_c0_g1_i1.p1  ORF type:complete len:509 (-),score=81.63 TRINITY_DN6590_c0_g1_i1:28-1554(-)